MRKEIERHRERIRLQNDLYFAFRELNEMRTRSIFDPSKLSNYPIKIGLNSNRAADGSVVSSPFLEITTKNGKVVVDDEVYVLSQDNHSVVKTDSEQGMEAMKEAKKYLEDLFQDIRGGVLKVD